MKPDISDITINIAEAERVIYPSYTYKAYFDKERVNGHTDELDALVQSVYCRLRTQRGQFPIYGELYGLPLNELIGQTAPLVYVNITSAITETLLDDDRITGVGNFVYDVSGNSVTVSFQVSSVFGEADIEGVNVNV